MDLKLIKIVDKNTNKERLVMYAFNECNLNEYIVLDTTYNEEGVISNRLRHVYIMPDIKVNKGDFVWLYTHTGDYHTHKNDSNTTTHNIYWGLDINIWNNEGDKAYLIHYDDWDRIIL